NLQPLISVLPIPARLSPCPQSSPHPTKACPVLTTRPCSLAMPLTAGIRPSETPCHSLPSQDLPP
ncbi:hypothetical protein BGZ61DRAFT_438355, partial [Ilyonectria robusta]|uniref:uncharacterized protein n=1 Tax=Ilyonectria robusta TaxID=1079257 RepID=UPI001E8CB7A7